MELKYVIFAAAGLAAMMSGGPAVFFMLALVCALLFGLYLLYKRNQVIRKLGHRYEDIFIVEKPNNNRIDLGIDQDLFFWANPGEVSKTAEFYEKLLERSNNQRNLEIHVFRFDVGERVGETEEEFKAYVVGKIKELRKKKHTETLKKTPDYYYQVHRGDNSTSERVIEE